jgi:hypothetical protein
MPILNLPGRAVPDRVSLVRKLEAGESAVYADLDGPGCIQHIWATIRGDLAGRRVVIRIYFDDEPEPYVEAPLGDFFGVMHGLPWYPINTPYLSVKAQSGYNCYFPMPFAQSARVEFEGGDRAHGVYLMVDWHRYPDQRMEEPRRFCARWRREMPTQRYGEDFVVLDADGPGQFLGFAYGVRLLDDVDRWSHGGGDNIYVDGEGDPPAFLRGIGGEDTFGTSYGGAIHPPETHLYAALPYYVHEDVSQARPAQRLVGYRFFEPDALSFQKSIHVRFGCMRNDICATAYWYQEGPVRPFFKMPDWPLLLPGVELKRGDCDLSLPESGVWWLCGPFGNAKDRGIKATLEAEIRFDAEEIFEGNHEAESPWLTEGSRSLGRDRARWVRRKAVHGFVDFNHVFRPYARGAGKTHDGVAVGRCVLNSPADQEILLQLAWDDRMMLRLNGGDPIDLGIHSAFRQRSVPVALRAGRNILVLKLSNTRGTNHGGWTFAFRATTLEGAGLLPETG